MKAFSTYLIGLCMNRCLLVEGTVFHSRISMQDLSVVYPTAQAAPRSQNYPSMVGRGAAIPNADSMNGGILGLTCEISHQAVIYVTHLNS